MLKKPRAYTLEKTPLDTVLLLHGMMLMSDFRGEPERAMLTAFLKTLPEFHLEDIDDLRAEVAKLQAEYPSPRESIEALRRISSDAVKKKTFILALDIAMASGAIDATEDDLLEDLRNVLGIELDTAETILDVLSAKYAS
jgi:tellurite resistance protein